MSVLKLSPQRDALRALNVLPRNQRRPSLVIGATLMAGFIVIAVLSLLITIATSAGVYEISALKTEKKNLTESVQILSAQVDSLSSAQNLSGAAQKLGMVANSNPVFLNVTKKRIYGKPMAAIKSSTGRITKNLVPNAQLTTKTRAAELKASKTSAVEEIATYLPLSSASAQNGYVVTAPEATRQVISSGEKLPSSPTN